MRFIDVLNESNVKLRKSESTFLGRLENENVSNIIKEVWAGDLGWKIRSFGWPPTLSHKKCHRTRHYVAVVACRRRSKSEKPKAVPESPQNRRRKRIVVNTRPDVPSQESQENKKFRLAVFRT